MKKLFCLYFLVQSYLTFAQIEKVEPPFWWEGMQESTLQLMLYGNNLAQYDLDVPSLRKIKVHRVENSNYLFVDLDLTRKKPGEIKINLIKDGQVHSSINYEIKTRNQHTNKESFNSSDVIYLLMPDRFANGNSSNDIHSSVSEKTNRNDKDGRHGGDLNFNFLLLI